MPAGNRPPLLHTLPPKPPHAKDLRKGRWSEVGHAYHVTATTKGRQTLFRDLFNARCVIRSLMQSDVAGWSSTWAFVLMPDHLHWLRELRRGTLAQVVGSVKSVSAHQIGGRVWQPGYHDHALRTDEDLRAVARYIVANPLRAGLVARIGDYPHWDAAWI
jgi:REP element-mobilizing transposase RayT